MECFVEDKDSSQDQLDNDVDRDKNITFLYTLGEGSCPKSFGINVARLAGLPEDVLQKAKNVSASFEASMNNAPTSSELCATALKSQVETALQQDWSNVEQIWESLQQS
mmetsp:Transcript_1155/g.1068  ORF Transcript_1155/g.1068 Transcript_1155/m.1068 type:complete len:109 (-) Transcript_1155:67-393(-)